MNVQKIVLESIKEIIIIENIITIMLDRAISISHQFNDYFTFSVIWNSFMNVMQIITALKLSHISQHKIFRLNTNKKKTKSKLRGHLKNTIQLKEQCQEFEIILWLWRYLNVKQGY